MAKNGTIKKDTILENANGRQVVAGEMKSMFSDNTDPIPVNTNRSPESVPHSTTSTSSSFQPRDYREVVIGVSVLRFWFALLFVLEIIICVLLVVACLVSINPNENPTALIVIVVVVFVGVGAWITYVCQKMLLLLVVVITNMSLDVQKIKWNQEKEMKD